MENYSTLTRDKSFQKKTFKYIASITCLVIIIYGAISIAENYFAGNTPSGKPRSSYATVKSGANAWSQLLEATGFAVVRDKGSVSLPELGNIDKYSSKNDILDLTRETSTVIILESTLPDDEINEVIAFVENGGRLITDNPDILFAVFGDNIEIAYTSSTSLEINDQDINGTDGISEIEGSGVGSISTSNSINAQGFLVSGSDNSDFSTAAIIQLDQGDVIALMDTGIVSNEGISRKDNALLSIRIAGQEGGDVTFVEGIHGFSTAKGFNGMPLAWKISIIGLIAAFIVFGSAKARRFGVGEEAPRDLGPKRILYAHALAEAMKKTKR